MNCHYRRQMVGLPFVSIVFPHLFVQVQLWFAFTHESPDRIGHRLARIMQSLWQIYMWTISKCSCESIVILLYASIFLAPPFSLGIIFCCIMRVVAHWPTGHGLALLCLCLVQNQILLHLGSCITIGILNFAILPYGSSVITTG